VFLYHSQQYLFPGYEDAGHTDARNIILSLLPSAYGLTGVQLFLIISGFLIHLGFISRNKSLNIATFYSKRFWRIYPPYLLVLIIFCLTGAGINYYLHSHYGLRDLLSHLFFIHNLSDRYIFSINPSFWTLALEMQLYLIYPVFLFIRKKLGVDKTMILIFLLVPVSWFASHYLFPQSHLVAPCFITNYWFNWCAGAFLAERYWNSTRVFGRHNLLVAIVGFFAIILSGYFISFALAVQLSVFTWVAFFEWILYAKINISNRFNKIMALIGIISYSIYLIHQPILRMMLSWYNLPGQQDYWAMVKPIPIFILIAIVSYFTHKYIELPSIQLGYFFRKKDTSVKK
jgi:peptidoglycan/LPS O-acetylase OafA/YrhL